MPAAVNAVARGAGPNQCLGRLWRARHGMAHAQRDAVLGRRISGAVGQIQRRQRPRGTPSRVL